MKNLKEKLLIIDGHAMIFRAYHAMVNQNLTNSDGMPVGTIFSFYRMLAKLLQDQKPNYFLLIFDPKGDTFRNELYPEYKMNRGSTPDDLVPQLEEIQKIALDIGMPVFIPEKAEADDAIASVAKKYKDSDMELLIVSGDKDLYNILYPNVSLLRPKKGVSEFIQIKADYIHKEIGIRPEDIPEYMAITGDSSDNIPGVKGIGPKGAAKLIQEYKDLESIYQNLDKITPQSIKQKLIDSKEMAFLSRQLVTLKKDILIPFKIEDISWQKLIEKAHLFKIFREKELNTVYEEWSKLSGGKSIVKNASIGQSYFLIKEKSDWKELEQKLKGVIEIAIDTETDNKFPTQAELIGISIAWKKNGIYQNVYIPCVFTDRSQQNIEYENIPNGKEVIPWVRGLLEDEKIEKVGQNIKYDWIVLRKYGIVLKNVTHDTMLLSYLINPSQRRHNLDDLSLDHLGHTTIKYKDLVGSGKKLVPLISVSIQKLAEYACEDAEITLRLKEILMPRLHDHKVENLYQKIDRPLIYPLIRMEENGILLDQKALKRIQTKYEKKLKQIEANIYEIAGEEFNIKSTNELRRILFDKLGISSIKKTEKGHFSTEHKILEKLKHEHPIINTLLEFRLISKLLNTYIIPLPKYIHPNTNRIHTSFSQVTAATGRLASVDPNLQNIPIKGKEGREIRSTFTAEKGNQLLSLDYNQIELRILAHYSKDEKLMLAYQKDHDIHDQAAYLLFHHKFDMQKKNWNDNINEMDVTSEIDAKKLTLMKATNEFKDMRSKAKVLNFSIMYGVTSWGLGYNLGISKSEAALMIEAYFKTYPKIKLYMNEIISTTRINGYCKNFFGRHRKIEGLSSSNRFTREAAERLAMNTPIQSTAADIIKLAMIQIQQEIDARSYKSKMLLQIHDELLFEVVPQEKDEFYEMAKKIMENIVELDVPLKVNGGLGDNWDAAK